MGFHPRTIAVFGMLADKDIAGVVEAVRARIDRWFVADAAGAARRDAPRCACGARAERAFRPTEITRRSTTSAQRFARARSAAGEADRIVVFGSFLTVAAALAALTPGATVAATHG